MESDNFELDLPSGGDDVVQLEQREDEKQISCEICGNNQKSTTQLHCYTFINDIKYAEKDAKAQGKEALLCFRKTKKLGGNAFALAMYRYRSKCTKAGG